LLHQNEKNCTTASQHKHADILSLNQSGILGTLSEVVSWAGIDVNRDAAWEVFRAGVDEAFQEQRWPRWSERITQDATEWLRGLLYQIQEWQAEARRRRISAAPSLPWPGEMLPFWS
jgi:hypothetical protein